MTLERWTRDSNYAGKDYSDYYMVAGQNRDSDYVVQSNFIAATNRLGGENYPDVIIARAHHWACGWVELLMVHKDALDKLEEGERIREDIDECIILDWKIYDELKAPEVRSLFDQIKNDIERGNISWWECLGVKETMTDEELLELITDHVS